MLNSLRNFASTWLGKLLGVLLLIGLAGFGISGVISNIGTTTVARVGGTDISTRQFQRAYQAQVNAVAQRTGSVPTAEQAMALGIPSQVINQLAADAALTDLGNAMGLGASDDTLGTMVREDPNFAGVLGQFDRSNFQRALQYNGYTEAEYLRNLRNTAKRQQIVTAVFQDVPVPDTALNLLGRYANDKRTVEYLTLSGQSLLPPEEPTEDEMAAYLKEHQQDFRTTPTRTAKVLVLSPDMLAANVKLSEDEIAAEYEKSKANYVQVEIRHVRQAVLPDDAAVQAFQQGLDSGKSFDDLVAETGVSVTDLGTLSEAQISDQALADAAFSLDEGSFKLIPAAQGMRAITVSDVQPGGQMPLEQAHDQIAEKLRQQQARNQYVDVLDQIEELRAAFQPLDKIAERFDLKATEIQLTSDGKALSEVPGLPQDGQKRVADAIFAANQGDLTAGIPLSSNLNVWFDLEKVTPARDQTLDEVRDQVHQAIVDQRTADELAKQADEVLASVRGGQTIEAAATSRNLFPQLSQPFTRAGDNAAISPTVADAAFNGPVGYVGSAQNNAGDYVIFHVISVTPAEDTVAAQVRSAIANAMRDNIYGEFVQALTQDAGVHISQQTLSQTLALNTGQ